MARKISRRILAAYIGDQLIKGESKAKLTRLLAGYLIDSKRTKEIDLIVKDIEYYLSTRGVVMATVTSAFDLSAATKQSIEKLIRSTTDAKTIHLTEFIDKATLGGMKLGLPGRELDTTIARKLTTLRTNYKKA